MKKTIEKFTKKLELEKEDVCSLDKEQLVKTKGGTGTPAYTHLADALTDLSMCVTCSPECCSMPNC